MSIECDIARCAIKKHALMAELSTCREEIKALCQKVELPFAVEIDGVAVTITRASYDGSQPMTKVLPLHKGCQT